MRNDHVLRRHLLGKSAAAVALLVLMFTASMPQADIRAEVGSERLTSRPRPAIPAATTLTVGDEVRTHAGQRRRLELPDRGVLYVNENTVVKLDEAGKLNLRSGEVYVETEGTEALVIQTRRRQVSGRQSSFAVRADAGGAAVLVTRGQTQVSGVDDPIRAGHKLASDADRPVSAPRASLLLDWTRELRAAVESPLIPASQHAGGALVAVDPNGQERKLTLRKYHVEVLVEDGFARTTIDQTYFNDDFSQMEGTFYFPLPSDASLSQLAMYVDGNLMEGGMVERDLARNIYETIRYRNRDPALLEWVDGSTFKMRVFPIEGRQEKRLLLSYTQKLPTLYEQTQYRFPAGHSLPAVRDWSFHARVKDGAALAWNSPSHAFKATKDSNDLLLDASVRNARFDRDVVLALGEAAVAGQGADKVRLSMAEQDGTRYLMVRFRPDQLRPIKDGEQAAPARQPRNWVFLFESSGDRDPLLARVQIEVVRGLLAQAEADDNFTVLTAGTRVRAHSNEPQAVTPANVQAAMVFLENSHLIGALDLGQALSEAEALLKKGRNSYLVHVGTGIAAMGERREDVLARRIPEGTRYVGVGVGRRWSRSFMKDAAERSGGYFTQINPDEPIGWRVFDLGATVQTLAGNPGGNAEVYIPSPRGSEEQPPFLYYSRSLTPGEELCAITRLDAKANLPAEITVRFDGKEQVAVPLRDVAGKADYLPRAWAKLEIERLLAEDAVKHKESIVALSKAMYVMTPYTSLLVLENEDMYTQYKVDRNRKDHWAVYPCPPRIQVVYEPDPDQPDFKALKAGLKLPARQLVKTVFTRNAPQLTAASKKVSEQMLFSGTEVTGSLQLGLALDFGVAQGRTIDGDGLLDVAIGGDFRRGAFDGRSGATRLPEPDFEHYSRLQVLTDASKSTLLAEGLKRRIDPSATFNSTNGPQGLSPAGTFTPDLNIPIITGSFTSETPPFGGYAGFPFVGSGSDGLVVTGVGMDVTKDHVIRRPLGMFDDSASMDNTGTLLYQRPSYSGQDGIFYDLVAYARGLNTSWADVASVLDAGALPDPRSKPGKIDDGARALMDKARPSGWQAFTLNGANGQPGFTLVFDGTGRYAWERTLSPGIRERVVCDGRTLLHLYPQLGLAASRPVGRFHRIAFFTQVPWALPNPEDLARGADLKLVGPRTVAVVPHGADAAIDKKGKPLSYTRLQFVFGEDGSLAERQLVRQPEGKVLLRQVCTSEGVIRLLDKDDKELSVVRGQLKAGKQPNLSPDTKSLVVLPLPYRTREYLVRTLKLDGKPYTDMRFADALQLMAADFAAGNNAEMLKVFREAFHGRDQRQLGFYVLLAAAGHSLDSQNVDVLAEHPDEPLAQYLTLHSSPVLRKHAAQWAVTSMQWTEPFLKHLAQTHALYQRWGDDRVLKGAAARVKADRIRALEYVRQHKDSAFGWALLCLLQDRAGKDKQTHGELAEYFKLFEDQPGLAFAARYEQARCFFKSGQREQARKHFRDLYERTLKDEVLPAIDADFMAALQGNAELPDAWSEVMTQAAAHLRKQKHRAGVLALAKQTSQLGDLSLANQLAGLALAEVDGKERVPLTLAAIDFYKETSQLPQAEELVEGLLADPKLAGGADLWRLAAGLAEQRDRTARTLECLERALDAEFRHLPAVIDLQTVRREYGKVLEHYQNLVRAMETLKVRPPEGFLAKVVRTADRWRALDREATTACQTTARIVRALGDRELGWDYLTTPIALQPGESGPWSELAQTLQRTGEAALADRAYKAAWEAEPTNADLLWARAEHLRQTGKAVEAQQLFRQIADGRWQPRFQPTQARARSLLSER